MSHRKTEDGMFLLGGALLGAAAMYLLDPQMGDRRRRQVAGAAHGALDSASEAIGEGVDWGSKLGHRAMECASEAIGDAREWGSKVGKRAMDTAHETMGDARDWGSKFSQRAAQAAPAIMSAANDAASRAHRSAARSSKHMRRQLADSIDDRGWGSTAGWISGTAVTGAVVGTAAMYFMDSQLGRARRAQFFDAVSGLIRRTGDSMRMTGRQIAERLSMSGKRQDVARQEPWRQPATQDQTSTQSTPSASSSQPVA